MNAGRRSELLTATLVVLAATVVVTWPLAAHITTHVSGHWDSYFSVWRLAWIADAVRSSDLQLFEAPIFFLQPHALALSDAILLPGIASARLRYAGVGPTLVYNIILFAAFASSGAAMFLLVRTLSGRSDAATIAAVIYALAPYRLVHLDHLEMQMAAWMPLVLWLWHRVVDEGRTGAAAAAVGGVVLQWLSCIYYGLLFAPFLAVMMAVEWTGIARGRRLRVFGALTATAVVGVGVIAMYSMPYLDNRAATRPDPWSLVPD